MALTSTGLEIKRYPEIVIELEQQLRDVLGQDVDLTTDSWLGIINQIYANSIASEQALSQAVYNAFNIRTAEGKQLDDLVDLVGIRRLNSSNTVGEVSFTGSINTTISTNTILSDVRGNNYSSTVALQLSPSRCYKTIVGVVSAEANELYSLVINGSTYSHTTTGSPSVESIISGLLNDIGVQSGFTVTDSDDGQQLIIKSDEYTNSLNVFPDSAYLSNNSVTAIGRVQNTQVGAIEALANTITTIETPIAGLTSVNNPFPLNVGRDIESDEELRTRHGQSVEIAGTATVPAIIGTLLQVTGVISASVVENRDIVRDSEGRPAKSYECIVDGGTNLDVANAIWETKPAGIELYGNTSVIVDSFSGQEELIRFSRPQNVFIWVEVDYTLYDEEVFPVTGERDMKAAIVAYGNSTSLGEDAIPKRTYGSIYQSTSGVEDVVVRFGVSDSPNIHPTAYSTDVIEVGRTEVTNFSNDRITMNLVV